MQTNSVPLVANTWDYLKKHWFKVGLLLLIIMAAFKRDFKFSIQLGGTATATEKKGETEIQGASNTTKSTELGIATGFFDTKNEKTILESVKLAYLKRFAQVAVNEQKKFRIPASITLSIAFVQSKAGTSERSTGSNNHFDLLATNDWKAEIDSYNNLKFRKYDNAWLSFRDHSLYLTGGKFSGLTKASTINYKIWLKNLQQLGYADNSESFLKDVQTVIEKYKLYRLDK